MGRCQKFGFLILIGVALAAATPGARATTVSLDFPSTTSTLTTYYGLFHAPLDSGGGGRGYLAGDGVSQEFDGTGLSSAASSEWQFTMSNFTSPGVTSTFNVLINGTVVGSYSFLSTNANFQGDIPFDLDFSFSPISGPDFILDIVATSTGPTDSGSWDFIAGGTVALSDVLATTPLPASLPLLVGGLGALGLLGWLGKRKSQSFA
jgi:hypothetical protein